MASRGSRKVKAAGAPSEERVARKERRQQERRGVLLTAARAVLARQGVAGLTMEAVATEADVSKPAVFYYFRSKEELVGELAVEQLEAEVAVLEAAVASADSGVAALAALARAKVDFYAEDLDAFRVAYLWPQLIGLAPELLRQRVYPLSQRVNDALEARLREDARQGLLAPGFEPRRLANLAWTTAHGLLALVAGMERLGGGTRHTLVQLRDEACALLLRAGTK